MTDGAASPRVRLEPMTWDDFDAWSERSVRGFAAQQTAAGLHTIPEATAYAEKAFADLLPAGLATPTHLFWTVHVGDAPTVGYLWLRVCPCSREPGECEAYVFDVEIVPEARGRGLGRATMLAAEDAARDLGATVMRLNVFGHNTVAIRLYEGLGYVVTISTLTKRLDPEYRPGDAGPLRLRDMTPDEYAVFRTSPEVGYEVRVARPGALSAAEAVRTATDDLDRLLPDGPATGGHRLWTALDGEDPVGRLWVHLQRRSDGLHASGYEFHVREDRHGYERSIMRAAEHACRELGVVSVGLSVPGFDSGARALCEHHGFGLTAQTMAKSLVRRE